MTSSSAADEPAVTMTRSGATVDAVVVGVVARDRRAQRGQAERRRVVDAAARDRPLRRGDHRCRRREVGLADLHVDDRPRPAASSARAAVCTSITWKGAISATRAASLARDSIESLSPQAGGKRYRNAPMHPLANALAFAASGAWPSCSPGWRVAGPAGATIYKCDGPRRHPVYQDEPCPAGKAAARLRQGSAHGVGDAAHAPAPGTSTREVLPAPARRAKAKTSTKAKQAAQPRQSRRSASSLRRASTKARSSRASARPT